jgi:hypothetical protein
MRRWMFMAALSTILFAGPLWGQRGGHGGMAMGGMRGGYVAHGGGFVGAPHGAYWAGGFHGPHGSGFPGHPGHHPSHPIHYPYYWWRYPWWGYRGYYGYPWGLGWYGGVGVVGSDASYTYPAESHPGYAYSPVDNPSAYIADEQQQEIERLNDEVARLGAERAPANAAPEPPAAEIHAETVLVFRDRHSEEIQNYAIVGNTLWVFTQQRARKIPIAELDVPATAKANADRGIDFRLPGQ